MNLRALKQTCIAQRRGESAFTMAEIAIALGVIAIALIAILGVLPSGLQVQRDNREETIINQDARLLLQALKTAGREDWPVSDLGSFVVVTNDRNNNPVSVNGIPTDVLLQFLCDPTVAHTNVLAAISGGVVLPGRLGQHRFLPVRGAQGDALADLSHPGDPLRAYLGFVEPPGEAPMLLVVSLHTHDRVEVRVIRGPEELYGVFQLGRPKTTP